MEKIGNFFKLINYHTVIVTILAVVSTYLCHRFQWEANMPSGLIGIAVVFPIVFSINAAYRRREEALRYYGSLKAHAVSLIWAHRDWNTETRSEKVREQVENAKNLVEKLISALQDYFLAPRSEEDRLFKQVYETFGQFSHSHEELRKAGLAANEVSRANQYLRAMAIEFERMKNIRRYRTPVALRAYSFVFLNSFPILFGPYFAYLIKNSNTGVGYAVAVIYSLVLVSLDNIQEGLEDPFDQTGMDDIKLDVADEYVQFAKD